MPIERDPAFERTRRKREPTIAELPKPKPKVRVFTRAEIEREIRSVRHELCIEHVAIEGLREPVCITKRDDREQVLRDVEELMGRKR